MENVAERQFLQFALSRIIGAKISINLKLLGHKCRNKVLQCTVREWGDEIDRIGQTRSLVIYDLYNVQRTSWHSAAVSCHPE